jgi:hypothetical protein
MNSKVLYDFLSNLDQNNEILKPFLNFNIKHRFCLSFDVFKVNFSYLAQKQDFFWF